MPFAQEKSATNGGASNANSIFNSLHAFAHSHTFTLCRYSHALHESGPIRN